MIEQIKINGLSYFIINKFISIKNKIYNLLIFNRRDINIQHPAKLNGIKYIKFGKNFIAGKDLRLEAIVQHNMKAYTPKIVIKDNVIMNDFVHIGCTNYIEIGNNVLMASKIYISDHNHGYYSGSNQSNPLTEPSKRIVNNDKKVIIGNNVWIGENVSILPGVKIGDGSVIGANSVVTKNIPQFSIAVGNPAKIVKFFSFDRQEWINKEK